MNIVVIGQGAIGSLWYQNLRQQASTGWQARLLLRKNLLKQHFTLTNSRGFSSQCLIFSASEQDLKSADVILVCVKSFSVLSALKDIHHLLRSDCIIILCHNGLGTKEQLTDRLSLSQPLCAMVTTHGAMKITHNHVIHTGEGQSDIGLLSGNLPTQKQQDLIQQLNLALPNVVWRDDINTKQWLKLAINAVINPLTARDNVANGKITIEHYGKEVTNILTEFVAIARCQGLAFELSELTEQVFNVAQATQKNCSSMRADLLAGRKTEIDFINGYLCNIAQQHGIAATYNFNLWKEIQKLEGAAFKLHP